MTMLESLGMWLKATWLSSVVIGYPWVWPTCESLHFMGLAILVGTVAVLDLRMLGVGKGLAIPPIHGLIRWGIAGFIINLVTGILFFVGTPEQYIGNFAFYMKMIFIVLAGVNVAVFYLTIYERVERLEPDEDAPLSAKIIAATSLLLWTGVIFFGRMLPFLGQAF
jgi:hypothetical protein